MARPVSRPAPPWRALPCPARELALVVGAAVRGDQATLLGWCRSSRSVQQVVDTLCTRHRMGPYLAARLVGTAVWASLPPLSRARVEESAARQVASTEGWLVQLREVVTTLRQAGIPCVVLKGGELGARFMGGATARAFRDLDLLIALRHRRDACRSLEGAGYFRLSRLPLGAGVTARVHHAVDYAQGSQLLDLHWSISSLPGLHLDTDAIMRRAAPLVLGGTEVAVLAPDDLLTLLLVSALADLQRGALRLQSVADVAAVAAGLPEHGWGAFFAQRDIEGTATICRGMLHLAHSLLALPVPPGLAGELPSVRAPDEALVLMAGREWVRRRWVVRQLPVSAWRYGAWWAFSLPFRTAASHPRWRRSPPAH